MNEVKHTLRSIVISVGVVALVIAVLGFFFTFRYPYIVGNATESAKLIDLAIRTSNPSICGKITLVGVGDITQSSLQTGCYYEYIKAHPEANICPSHEYYCLAEYALLSNQPDLCMKLPKIKQRLCISEIVGRYAHVELCELLPPQDMKDCRNYYRP